MLTPDDANEQCLAKSRLRHAASCACTTGGTPAPPNLIKLAFGRFLICSNAACFDLRSRVVLAFDRLPGDSPQHRQLADVRQRVRDWTLKKPLAICGQLAFRSEIVIELAQRRVKSLDLLRPRKGFRVVPGLIAFRDRQ